MATVSSYLGLFPNECETFPLVDELRWSISGEGNSPSDLGIAPTDAYLPLTKERAVFAFWRVKKWEIIYEIGPVNINNLVTFNIDVNAEENNIILTETNFSFPQTTVSRIVDSPHLFINDTEKNLVCRSFNPFPANSFTDTIDIAINSSNTLTFPVGGGDPEFNDNSRNTAQESLAIQNPSFLAGVEFFINFDVGKKDGLFYWPFTIDLFLEIGSANTDGNIFDETAEVFYQNDPNSSFTGTLPPIVGYLTTVPRGSNPSGTLTTYKARIEFQNENDFIELDLFDITPPSPLSNTKFNIDGFNGITIKPKEYWEYDPNDGGGPIYDSTTGQQLRPFP